MLETKVSIRRKKILKLKNKNKVANTKSNQVNIKKSEIFFRRVCDYTIASKSANHIEHNNVLTFTLMCWSETRTKEN